MISASRTDLLFLTPDEVTELTGFKTFMRQVEWLRSKGWRFELNGIRRPIMAHKYGEKMLACRADYSARPRPNFQALAGLMRQR